MTRTSRAQTACVPSLAAAAVAVVLFLFTVAGGASVFASPAPEESIVADPQRFGFGQPMRVDEGERVDSIVTVGSDLTVLGEVENDAIVIGGTLELGPGATVGGDAIAVGGTVVAPESARIVGERVEVSGGFGRDWSSRSSAEWASHGERERWVGPLAASVATFVQVFAALLISALLLMFAPRRVGGLAEQIRNQPGRASVFGLAILLLFLPLLGALTLSIVGIPLIPVAVMLLAAIVVYGMTGLALALGQVVLDRMRGGGQAGERARGLRPGAEPWAALLVGYLVIGLVAWIPYLGAMLIPLAGLFAGGAVLARWFSGRGG